MSSHSNLQKLRQNTQLKHAHHLMALPQMRQAFHLMQLPILELAALVEINLLQNPLIVDSDEQDEEIERVEEPIELELDLDENNYSLIEELEEAFPDQLNEWNPSTRQDKERTSYLEQSIQKMPTLFEHLMQQAHETFDHPLDLKIAEQIIGNLSSDGFFNGSLEEIALDCQASNEKAVQVLSEIQKFDPFGIASRDLKECLLIQLKCLKKENSLAAHIIESHYDDLIHNKLPNIQEGLQISLAEIEAAITNQIAFLDLHPGSSYSHALVSTLVPDITVTYENEEFKIIINDEHLPSVHLNRRYMNMLYDPSAAKEVKEFLNKKLGAAKWLMKNIFQRNATLEKLAQALVSANRQFFIEPKGQIVPMTMKQLAEQLEVHESTVARAVANKYIASPRGLLPLRLFFTSGYSTENGEVSAHTVREAIEELIRNENQFKPFSDSTLSLMLQERGISCARRTITKYRLELGFGNTQQRKKFK